MNSAKHRIELAAAYIGSLRGWRRFGLALVLGGLSALSFAPYYASPLLWIVYPVLLWQLQGATSHRQAFVIGWAFFFMQFVIGFYWISVSMFTDIARWWWAVPFSSTVLPGLFAFNYAFAAMLWWRLRLSGLRGIMTFTALMMIAEWVRGHAFTGFPWNLTAHTWIAFLPLLQSYSLFGAYAFGFITIAIASLPSLFGDPKITVKKASFYSLSGIAILTALALWGWQRIPATPTASVPGAVVRLVQPNVAQTEKWTRKLLDDHFFELLRLSRQPALGPAPTIIVWPETALPYRMDQSPEVPRAVASALPPGGIGLIGAVRRNGDDYYDSVQVIDSKANLYGYYDKTHLVPYGEYMPFRSVLHLDAIAVGADMTAGDGPKSLTAPGLPPVSAMICYEAIFAEHVVDPAHRPAWLLQATNDAWFGNSSGPYQHFAMARARAVEQGLPLMRAANTGISGAVDPYGRILAMLPIGVQGVLDVPLPEALPTAPPYARYGETLFALMLALGLLCSFPFLQR